MQTVNATVRNVISKIEEKLPISFVQSGCNIKPVTGLMNVLNISLGEAQFLAMIRDIKLPTAESVGVNGYTQELRTEALNTFIGEFATKYAFDNKGADGNPIIKPDNVFQQVSNMMQDEAMLSRINLATLGYDSTAYVKDAHKVNMTYMALAGLLNTQLKKPIISVQPDGTEIAKNPPPITILTMSYDQASEMLGVVLSFDVTKMLGLDEGESVNAMYAKLISQVLPKEIFIKAQIPLGSSGKTSIKINNLNEQDSTELLKNITTLGVDLGINMSQFNIQELTDTLEKTVKDNLGTINEKIGAEIVFGADKCFLPSIFEVVSGLDMLKTDNVAVVTDEELHDMLRSAYTYTAGTPNKADNALALVGQIESKYYIKEGKIDGSDGNALLNSIKAIKDNFQNDFDVPRMAADNTPIGELKPTISQEELGFILQSSGKLDDIVSIIDNITIRSTIITTSEMKMQVEGDIVLTGENAKYSVLLPKKIYLNLTVDTVKLMQKINGDDVVCTSFDIDGMSQEQMTNFFEIASKLGGQPLDQTEICKTLDTKIASVMSELINDGNMKIVFVDGGIKLDTTVFDIAIDKIYAGETTKPTASEMRSVLQQVNTYEGGETNTATNALALVGQIESKYYINEGVLNGSDGNALLDSIKTIKDNFQDNFDVPRMAADKTDISELKPIMSQEELGFILQSSGKLNGIVSILDKISIVSTLTTPKDMKMQISGEIVLTGENAKYSTLLPKHIYLNLTVDTDKMMRNIKLGEDVEFSNFDIDGMNAEQMANFFSIASKIGGEPLTQADICKKLDTQIGGVMGDLVNGGNMDIAFANGGVQLDKTVFDIAVDQIYTSPTATKPTASQLRQVLQKVNIIPEEYKTNNLSTDMTAVVDEINTKYYLNTPLVSNDTIYDQISSISGNYLNIIDGKKMNDEYDVKTIGQLRPAMSGGELGRIFSTQVAIGGAGKGLDETVMTSLKVLSETSMEIVFTAKIAVEETNKYKQLLPNAVSIVVDFDKSKTNDATKPCTTFTINDMTADDINVFTGLVQAVDSTANLDIDELNKSASDQLKEKIKSLSGESDITLSTADIDGNRVGGTITMSSIFGLAVNKIYEGETTKPTEQALRYTLHALWTPVNVVGQSGFTSADEMKEEQIKATLISPIPPLSGNVEIEVTDRNIGAILQNKENEGKGVAESLGIDKTAVTYKQTLLFSPIYGDRQAVIDALNGTTFQTDKSYMMIGVNIKTSALITSTMLPDNIDVTALLDIDTEGYPFDLMVNNLSGEQKAIINKILTKNSGNASIFDDTAKVNLKNNILNTEVCKISAVGGVNLARPFTFRLRDMLGKIEKKDGHSVRHDEDAALIPAGTPFGGYIRVSDTVAVGD